MARKLAAIVFSLGCVQASPLMALGLGDIKLDSYLNEPLKAQVKLLNTGGLHEDQIRIRLATSDDFKRMGVDRAYFLTSISFDVQIDESGRAVIVLSSEDPVLEPYLDFIVEARWPSGRLLREYTVLVDPPVFDQSTPVVSASQRVAEVDGEPEPAKKKSSDVGGTGTRVDVRDGNLAPGEMPQRSFNSTTSPAAIPGSRYMIHRDDTLWGIASSARPSGTSVHQTMLDIQRLNPNAFIGGNINRIKAGYIIYLPTEDEISSGDPSAALREVSDQNKAWRENRESEPTYSSGPSLRISAEPEEEAAVAGTGAVGPGTEGTGSSAAALEDMDKSALERVELKDRLAAMEQQVETLQRIVTLKDDQIAALQGVLAGEQSAEELAAVTEDVALVEAGVLEDELSASLAEAEDAAATEVTDDAYAGQELVAAPGDAEVVELEAAPAVVEAVEEVEAPAVVEVEPSQPAAATPAPAQTEGLLSKYWYILVAALAAIIGFVVMRRGKGPEDDEPVEVAVAEPKDAFADVQLKEQALEVEEPVEASLEMAEEADEEPAPGKDNRGYGERKHDEYASDVEASDALAEADIYIAYGRYPQAVDLLKNAIANSPANPDYRLKLVQLYAETGDSAAAEEQLAELEALGDEGSVAAARTAMASATAITATAVDTGSDLDIDQGPGEEELLADFGESLEADFGGLEIEEPGAAGETAEEDLDLSADFDDAELAPERLEEDLVIAAESSGMSTKLDLARAYMDMGDDDGAKQILEEVAAEGTEDLQAEARALLERIG